MPPPSSPVPRLSSVPSAASTVHTIASRSPLRPIVPALRERDGRPPRPLLGDAIATTTPPHRQRTAATGQRLDGLPSCPPRPRPRSLPSGCEERNSKRTNRTRRERTRAKVSADIFARSSLPSSSAVPVILRHDLVRSLSSVRPYVFLFIVPRSPS